MSKDRDYALDAERAQGIIDAVRAESFTPIDITFQGSEERSTLRAPLGKVRTYEFHVGKEGEPTYSIVVGTQDVYHQPAGTVLQIRPVQETPNKWSIHSADKENGTYVSFNDKWGYHVFRTAVRLVQWTLRAILGGMDFPKGMFDTTELSRRDVIESTPSLSAYQERFDVKRPARSKKKIKDPLMRYEYDHSNPLTSSQIHRVMDTVAPIADDLGVEIKYRSRYLLRHYEWKYKFMLRSGDERWGLNVGTTAHQNDNGYDSDGDSIRTTFALQKDYSQNQIINQGGKQWNTLVIGMRRLIILQVALELTYQTMNAIYALPRHQIDTKERQRLFDRRDAEERPRIEEMKKERAKEQNERLRNKHSPDGSKKRTSNHPRRSKRSVPEPERSFSKPSPSQLNADTNQVYLSGYILHKPKYQVTQNGHAVANFLVASHRGYRNTGGDEAIDYINCVVWNEGAQEIHSRTRRNVHVGLVGILHNRGYEDRSFYNHSGEKRYFAQLVVNQFKILDY